MDDASGDIVAHIKFTVLLMPNGSDRITSIPLQPLQSSVTVEDPDVKAILNLSYKSKKKSAAKKKGEHTLVLPSCGVIRQRHMLFGCHFFLMLFCLRMQARRRKGRREQEGRSGRW